MGKLNRAEGSEYDRIVHIASSALPAAGAFTSQGFQNVPKGTLRITYWVTYTRGGAGGYPVFHHEYSNGIDVAREIIQDDSSLDMTSPPNGRVDLGLEELKGPVPADDTAIKYALTFQQLPVATDRVRLLVAEAGAVGTPGTIQVVITTDAREV